jgi:hypothetical protein
MMFLINDKGLFMKEILRKEPGHCYDQVMYSAVLIKVK